MEMTKKIQAINQAINPLRSDFYFIGSTGYGISGSIIIKRFILLGCGTLTLALGIITTLAFTGVLPIGLAGSIVFASASGVALATTLLYLGALVVVRRLGSQQIINTVLDNQEARKY